MPPQKVRDQSGWHDYLAARNAQLPSLPAVTKLSNTVVRILGGNPGDMQLQGTNTYLVGSGQTRILIDTGQGFPIWLTTLSNFLNQHQLSISHVLVTHWHPDHTGGLSALLAKYPSLSAAVYKADPERGQQSIRDGQTFTVPGATLRALFTPGHSHDHMCFLLEDCGAMFTGDNVLGHGTSVVVEDLRKYMKSLQTMKQAAEVEDIAIGYPGHGAMIKDLPAKITVYSRHWETRERRILSAFVGINPKAKVFLTTQETTARLYGAAMDAMAGPFVAQVLLKLAEEGKIGSAEIGQEKKWFVL
ncbi:hypothetical protein N7457_003653 [Penicillium paradoxum]|uniref:uncharacterized protein n=1 Tax=Penicillium paradoxum TaxID=176176 RepID=UPI002549AF1C|nr:uncharacterized protein N7457_003653 [Penicillium paradoxum]KAJ5788663.1 hypothetical protein N7457_003653 [Penicillium paradoxum]